jgi:hypothetical protein
MEKTTGGRRTKVARVIDEYGLTGIGEQLEVAWTGETGERTSLRDLADEFNEAVLESALQDVGSTPMEFEVSGTYEAIFDGSEADGTRARRRLEREGVDVDVLESDFVSHQAVHTYLKRDRDASLPDDDGNRRERKLESIEKLQGRLTAVTESALSSLVAAEELDHDDYDVLVDVRTVCPECGADRPISDLLRRGRCTCST